MKYFLIFGVLLHSGFVSGAGLEDQKLLMTPELRHKLNLQREQYLNPVPAIPDPEEYDIVTEEIPAEHYENAQTVIPDPLSVSAVIITPNKKKIVRLNGRYQEPEGKEVALDQIGTDSEKAAFKLNGKKVNVPVGYSYVPSKEELVKNYELDH